MTDVTDNLALPYLTASQAQKHVTLNDALRRLDAVVQLSVDRRDLAAPPSAPQPGARYLIAGTPTGAWVGQAGRIGAFQDGAWDFYAPREGWTAWVAAEGRRLLFTGGAWTIDAAERTAKLGVNAEADARTRLAVAAAATLLTHDELGDHRLTIDKATPGATASLIFSDAFSGRAELGLAGGDDDLCVKVSADGAVWRQAIRIGRSDGFVDFPAGAGGSGPGLNLLLNGDFIVNQRQFAGGALAAGAFGFDRWKADTGGATATRTAGVLTLSAGALVQRVEPALWGVDSLAARSMTLSVEGLTSGAVSVTVGSASGLLTAGVGVRSLTLQTAAGDAGPLLVRLAVSSGAPALRRVKLELGAHPTPWRERAVAEELRLCQRYFEASVPAGQAPATYAPGAGSGSIYISTDPNLGSVTPVRFLAPKRVQPAVVIRDGAGQAGKIAAYSASGWGNGVAYTGVLGLTDKGFSLQQNNAGVYNAAFDFTAEAEL